jgi:hypothetical protein
VTGVPAGDEGEETEEEEQAPGTSPLDGIMEEIRDDEELEP